MDNDVAIYVGEQTFRITETFMSLKVTIEAVGMSEANTAVAAAEAAQTALAEIEAIADAFGSVRTIIAAGDVTVGDERILRLNKTSGQATGVLLPAEPRAFTVLDTKGDANTNNITLTPQAGRTINGQASLVIALSRARVDLFGEASDLDWHAAVTSY